MRRMCAKRTTQGGELMSQPSLTFTEDLTGRLKLDVRHQESKTVGRTVHQTFIREDRQINKDEHCEAQVQEYVEDSKEGPNWIHYVEAYPIENGNDNKDYEEDDQIRSTLFSVNRLSSPRIYQPLDRTVGWNSVTAVLAMLFVTLDMTRTFLFAVIRTSDRLERIVHQSLV